MSLGGTLWRGAVVGALVLVAQVAFALPSAPAIADPHNGPLFALFAVWVGVPVSGVLLAGLAARFLGLARPLVVALAGLAFSVVLVWLSVRLGVPHLPTTADPGVLVFGPVFALPGYTAAAVAVPSVGLLTRGIAIGLAIAVTVAGSLGWVALTRDAREAVLAATGVPMIIADIPGYRLESVEVTDDNAPLVLYYVGVDRKSTSVTVYVSSTERQPRSCDDAYTLVGDQVPDNCQEVNGRWVFEGRQEPTGRWAIEDPDGPNAHAIAVHDNATVTFFGPKAPLMAAGLRTVSARELAAATPGRH